MVAMHMNMNAGINAVQRVTSIRRRGRAFSHTVNEWSRQQIGAMHHRIGTSGQDCGWRPIILIMPFVSITRLRVRAWRYLPAFIIQAFRSARQASLAPGNLAVTLLRDANLTFWTRTVWSEEAAMRAFMLAGVHRKVMPRLLEWCDEAAVAHWNQDALEPPAWDEAHQRLQHEGRTSKVNHPSPAHRRFEIPAPSVRNELKFK
jgi:heme-degrading monooxygenase HmoA